MCCPSGTHKTLLERKGKETEFVNLLKSESKVVEVYTLWLSLAPILM